jgi:hypothetical protein
MKSRRSKKKKKAKIKKRRVCGGKMTSMQAFSLRKNLKRMATVQKKLTFYIQEE